MQLEQDRLGRLIARASGAEAVRAQAGVLIALFRGQMIMKLGLYILAAIFVIVAALLVVFAPQGKETATTIIAIALFALAVGAAGFSSFALKTPIASAEAGESGQVVPLSVDRPARKTSEPPTAKL